MINDFFSMSEEDELISQLKKYDEAYYLEGNNPLISDLEYDQFKDSVKSKYPNNPYFQEVGFSVKGAKVKHEFILGSLNKVKEDNVDKWLSKFNPNDEIITFRHCVSSRKPFAEGAIEAALWLAKEPANPQIYGMEHLLSDNNNF